MDLWASPTLRSGGEDIAHALALMGVEPLWDSASTRVTGFSVVPQPKLAFPRLDVTVRISGTFRDTFPAQIGLIDQAARAVAALDEADEWNEPAAARRRGEAGPRIFGAAPGRYGAAIADRALDGVWNERAELGEAYLAASDHAYGGAGRRGGGGCRLRRPHPHGAGLHPCQRHAGARHPGGDERGRRDRRSRRGRRGAGRAAGPLQPRQLPAGGAEGAPARRGHRPHRAWPADASALDLRPARHGWRGAAELAEAIDTLFVFAASTEAVADGLFEAVFQAWCADAQVWAAIEAANAPAAAAIRARLTDAARRGLWTSRRNSVGAFLAREAAE